VIPGVFLDRDGTLIEEVGYLDRLDRLALFPWSGEAVKRLNARGFAVAVVTNQSGVAQGYFDEAFVRAVHRSLDARLGALGARIDGYYYCPHHPDAAVPAYRSACECRKPRPGLLERAARDLSVDLSRSFVVGDRWSDIALAQAAGARGILVRTGYGETAAGSPREGLAPAAVVADLMAAVTWILERTA
jgi:D-glycero-D-manno-heptose 1,7-bisphosphate phosphatase